MNIQKNNIDDLNIELAIELTPEDYKIKVEENLKKIRKDFKMPGFRTGHAPMGIIKKQFGTSVILEEINKLAIDSINNYVSENKFDIIGYPMFNSEKTSKIEEVNDTINYNFIFNIGLRPKVEVDISVNVNIEYPKITITDEIINKELELLRKQSASFNKGEVVDENSYVSGKTSVTPENQEEQPKEESSEDNDDLEMKYILIEKIKEHKKIYNKFLGANLNDTVTIDLSNDIENIDDINTILPSKTDKENNPDISGQKIKFVIKSIFNSKPAEINEVFFNQVFPGRNIKTIEDFKDALKENIVVYFKKQCDDVFFHNVRDYLLKNTTVEMPIGFIKNLLSEQMKQDKKSEKELEEFENNFEDNLDYIKWDFIKEKILKKYDLKIKPEDLKGFVTNFYNQHLKKDTIEDEIIEKEIQNLKKDKQKYNRVVDNIINEKILKIYKENLTITEVEYESFEKMVEIRKEKKEEVRSEKFEV